VIKPKLTKKGLDKLSRTKQSSKKILTTWRQSCPSCANSPVKLISSKEKTRF
jgi:hypothetical protein